ncbi:MAG: PilZ domain-containing protein [Deltaproteobacteria bacterium]|nr:PilZ domain-containing protein [Deltaproteobacteria bacterium]
MSPSENPERRYTPRFDKAFPVFLSGDRGVTYGVARNVSEGGMYVELADAEPLGSSVTVTFAWPGSNAEMSVEAEVRYTAAINFGGEGEGLRAICGVGLRFVRFLERDLYDTAAPELGAMH